MLWEAYIFKLPGNDLQCDTYNGILVQFRNTFLIVCGYSKGTDKCLNTFYQFKPNSRDGY